MIHSSMIKYSFNSPHLYLISIIIIMSMITIMIRDHFTFTSSITTIAFTFIHFSV